ncbi:MAG: hypothetical protein NTY81_01955 [Candidatus Staskawiczbacteria bacterium]|nr:hypothetical protein [Candidatus Staskawiczbacteria bacterium]
MNTRGTIKYIVIIIIILLAIFLSQKAYSWEVGKTLLSGAGSKASAYLSKGSEWATSKIYPKVTGEVQNRGAIIKNEVAQEKNKVSENIGEKISNYFSGVENSIVHPGDPQNCPAQTPPAK